MEPIRPEEVGAAKAKAVPDAVIDVFNQLIVKHFSGRSAVIRQDEALAAIMVVMNCDRHSVFTNKWLDVEEAFRAAGWKVKYDKPGYCESYEATFTFSR